MSADTRGIRELAEKFAKDNNLLINEYLALQLIKKNFGDIYGFMAAFAESIVEQCCKTICELCRNPNYGKPAYFKRHKFEDSQWWHMRTSPSEKEKDNVLCAAELIRSRWQRGEGQ